MRDLYGKDTGTTIDFRAFGGVGGAMHEAAHPWPESTRVSAGNGVVFSRNGNYTTLFMEVYPPGASGVGTTYHWAEVDGKMIFQCKEHAPKPDPERWIEDLLRNLGASHDDA